MLSYRTTLSLLWLLVGLLLLFALVSGQKGGPGTPTPALNTSAEHIANIANIDHGNQPPRLNRP